MTIFASIVLIVGIGLILLGASSGYALFTRAMRGADKPGDETNIGTLWGLFMLGLSAGLTLIWLALP